jgi:iron complex outermembrane receptor protein
MRSRRSNDNPAANCRGVPRSPPLAAVSLGSLILAMASSASAQVPAAPPAPDAPASPAPPMLPGGVSPPQVLTHVDAEYPASALASRRHADVVVRVTVDVDGHVSQVDIAESGGGDLDEAAVVAVRQWTFRPAQRAGKAVASRIRIPFHFAPPAPPPEMVDTQRPDELAPSHANEATSAAPAGPVGPSTAPAAVPSGGAPAAVPSGGAPAAEDIVVRGRYQTREHGTADYTIDVGALGAVPHANASDLLKLAPGILLTNEGGSGHAEQVFLRGFDAREGQDLEFTVDGVPINDAGNLHGNGYADTHFIIPELVEGLRVTEGPYAPQQGNFAVAGSADYHLGLTERGLSAKFTTGSYNSQRLLMTWGPDGTGNGTFGGAEYATSDGYGTNRQYKRGSAIGQYEGSFAGGTYRLTATAYDTVYNSAGVMRQDDYVSGRKSFYGTEDPNQTGNTASRYSLAIAYEKRVGAFDYAQQFFAIYRQMRLLEDFTGFLTDTQEAAQSLHDQRGDLLDLEFNEMTLGARGSSRWHGTFLDLPQEVELGYYARGDQTTSTQDRLQASNQVPYKREVDLTSTLGDIGLYADANLKVLPWLAFRGGVRADMFLFDVLNNCAAQATPDYPSQTNPQIDQSCFTEQEHGAYREPQQRYSTSAGAIMPRATALIGPFQGFTLSGSLGNGVRSIDPIYVSQGTDTPFVSTQSKDLGVAYTKHFEHVAVVAKSDFFTTHVDRDLIFDETEGRNVLSTGSTRTGWAGSARATGSFFDEGANLTFVQAKFDDTHLDVPYVPTLVLRSDTAVFHELPWHLRNKPIKAVLGYGLSYIGPRALPYGQTSDVIFTSDASLNFRWSIWQLGVMSTNLFGVKYRLGEYNYVSDFHSQAQPTLAPERVFTAGAPREIFFTIACTLGGAS